MPTIIFIFGLIIGSFLNAVIHRLHSGQSIASGRSACPHCGHVLAVQDLVPLLSFLWLRGQCAYCKKKISWQYPLVELITAVVFLLITHSFGYDLTNLELWVQIFFASSLIVIGVFDFKHYLILDKVLLPVGVMALIWNIYHDLLIGGIGTSGHLVWGVVSGLAIAAFFGIQYVVSKARWIGLGDVKFGLVLGSLFPGTLSICMLMLSYFSGALVGVGLIIAGRKQMSSQLPFGVFLAFSGIITMLWGEQIVAWYLRLIGL